MLRPRDTRAGFTLVELPVVIAIVGLLAGIGLTVLLGARRDSEVLEAEAFIESVGASIAQYRNQRDIGVYPPTSLEDLGEVGKLANKTNMGIEALCVALNSARFKGEPLFEKFEQNMENVDEDFSKKPLTTNPTTELWEMVDPWGNPYAYFAATDYDRNDVRQYVTLFGDGDTDIVTVKPWINPKTKSPYNKTSFQLFSAGPDGKFNTEDDIGNWQR